jgi:hypothetical protein
MKALEDHAVRIPPEVSANRSMIETIQVVR